MPIAQKLVSGKAMMPLASIACHGLSFATGSRASAPQHGICRGVCQGNASDFDRAASNKASAASILSNRQ